MFDSEEFKEAVRNKQYYHFGNVLDFEYNWYDYMKLVATHPENIRKFVDEKKRVELAKAHERAKLPRFAKDILINMRKMFTKNHSTLVCFSGMTDHRSLDIHKDSMDVLYLQVLGEITWEIWQPTEEKDDGSFKKETTKRVWHKRFTSGDLIWIPRGTYHQVVPHGARVGFSFGVEDHTGKNKIDPSTYI